MYQTCPPPNPLLGGHKAQRISDSCEGLTHFNMYLYLSASDWRDNLTGGTKRSVERGLEVATITYLRVSGLEGLGSPIISGVGSG